MSASSLPVGALDGVRVIEGSAFIAAPMAGMSLAQLGADVIRFDQIGGGIDYKRLPVSKETGASLYWAGLNKGKRSIALNLRDPAARELIHELVGQPGPDSGVFLTNFAGVKWLSYDALKEKRDDVIKVEISGNYDGTTALDYTVNAAVGYPLVTGPATPDTPVNHVLPAWDVACALQAALGVTAALMYRQRTGKGQEVKLALSDVALSVVASTGHVAEAQINGEQRPINGNYVHGAFGRDFGTKDGRRVSVMAISDKQWTEFCKACGLTEKMQQMQTAIGMDFNIDVHRYEAREAISAEFQQWFDRHSLAEVEAAFNNTGVCWDLYQTFTELVDNDPRCSEENPMFKMVDQPGIGEFLSSGSPLRFGEQTPDPVAAPIVGQHTDEILAEVLGLDAHQIGKLHDNGTVAGASADTKNGLAV